MTYFEQITQRRAAEQTWDNIYVKSLNQTRDRVTYEIWDQVHNQIWDKTYQEALDQTQDLTVHKIWDEIHNEIWAKVQVEFHYRVLKKLS